MFSGSTRGRTNGVIRFTARGSIFASLEGVAMLDLARSREPVGTGEGFIDSSKEPGNNGVGLVCFRMQGLKWWFAEGTCYLPVRADACREKEMC